MKHIWTNIEAVAGHFIPGKRGMRSITLATGCFDRLHLGHALMLKAAKASGRDPLIVGIDSDVQVRRLKGESRPIVNEADRALMLAQLACVDGVFVFDSPMWFVLDKLKPVRWCKGGDYTRESLDKDEVQIADSNGTRIVIIPKVRDYSTTKLLKRREHISSCG